MASPTVPRGFFDKLATVYARDPATKAFSVALREGLACRLGTPSAKGATSAEGRAELVSVRVLFWDPAYEIPDGAQVEIDGERWNPNPGTFAAPTWPFTGQVVYRSCDLTRSEA